MLRKGLVPPTIDAVTPACASVRIVLILGWVLSLVAVLLVLVAGEARAGDAQTVDRCLDGELVPAEVIENYEIAPRRWVLKCGSPISYGVLHIDFGHPIRNSADFYTCMSKIIYNGRYSGQGTGSGHQKWTVDIPGGEATVIYEGIGGNIVTAYTTGRLSNNWQLCASI